MASDTGDSGGRGDRRSAGRLHKGSDKRHPAQSANWDDRIKEARAKRALALAEREKNKSAVLRAPVAADDPLPVPPPTDFRPQSAPVAATLPDTVTEPETGTGPLRRDGPPDKFSAQSGRTAPAETTGHFRQRPELPPLNAQIPPVNAKTGLRSFSDWLESTSAGVRVAVIAFACCFGLGFGMVLSFGLMAALGWTSPGQQSASLNVQTQNILADSPPEALTRSDFGLIALPPGRDDGTLQLPGIVGNGATSRTVPTLNSAEPADRSPSVFLSPGPLIQSGLPFISPPVTAFAPVESNWSEASKLAYVTQTPSLPGGSARSIDRLPVLADRNKISLWTELSALQTPSIVAETPVTPRFVSATTVSMPSPKLTGSQPGTAPVVTTRQRVIPAAFSGEIAAWQPERPVLAPLRQLPADISPRPDIAAPSNVLYSPDIPGALPQAGGPHSRDPSLAGRLGLGAAERTRYRLVTFAPTSVTDSAISDNLQILTGTGLTVGGINRVNFRVSRTHIRYYYPEDRTVATAVAAEVGGQARDFVANGTTAPSGRVEIWMEGSRAGSAPAAPRVSANTRRAAPAPTAAQRLRASRDRLRSRLIESLRKGEYK